MPGTAHRGVLRAMTAADVPAVLDVQEPGAVRSLASVFPQDRFPFPRDEVAERWRHEVAAPDIECLVIQCDGVVVGFVAVRQDELLHFGVAVEHWGAGIAALAHDAVLERMTMHGIRRAWLRVFTSNLRARRFYERLGWRPTGERSHSSFPPHPELMRYERALNPGPAGLAR